MLFGWSSAVRRGETHTLKGSSRDMTEETIGETTALPPTPAAAPTLAQKLAAETIGTFILVVFGCGAAMAGGLQAGDPAFNGTTGLAFGLAIVVTVYSFGRISGGHFNPAVSAGAAVSGRISWMEAGYYAAAQIVGAIVGALVLWITYHGRSGFKSTDTGLGANTFGGDDGIHWWAALIIEIILTAVFVFVILAVTDTRNEHPGLAPLAIGLTLAAIHFVAIPLTGTSVNPARSIGPALFSGSDALKDLWVFIIAPLLGAAAAGVGYPAVFGRTDEPVPGSGWQFVARQRAAAPVWVGPDQFQQQWNQQEGWGQQAPVEGQPAQQEWGQQEWAQPAAEQYPTEQTQVSGQSWQQPSQPAAEGELPVYEQDGWRWDYAKQQWVPIEDPGQQPPPQG